MSKSLVKTPIKWAYKYDSIIHKNRSFKGISKTLIKILDILNIILQLGYKQIMKKTDGEN